MTGIKTRLMRVSSSNTYGVIQPCINATSTVILAIIAVKSLNQLSFDTFRCLFSAIVNFWNSCPAVISHIGH